MKTFIIAALTADGFIGRDSGHTADWTGKADKKVFVRLTKEAGTLVLGARTFATIGRALPGRRNIVYTSRPKTITAEGIETTNESPANLCQRLKEEGATALAICGGASVYTQFLQAGVVDELYIVIVPVIFGRGVTLFHAAFQQQLELLEATPLEDGATLLHYCLKH